MSTTQNMKMTRIERSLLWQKTVALRHFLLSSSVISSVACPCLKPASKNTDQILGTIKKSAFTQHLVDLNLMSDVNDGLKILHLCGKDSKLDTVEEYEMYKLKKEEQCKDHILNEKLHFRSHSLFNTIIQTRSGDRADNSDNKGRRIIIPETIVVKLFQELKTNFKLTSDSRHINGNALKTPLNLLKSLLKSLPPPEKASLPVTRYSYGDKAEVDGVLWSCCEMQFELFSTYNNHKTLVHLIDELKCSVCIEKSFSSFDEIEKHYLDVHIDSSWTSFHCLDCRLVFGVKSSFFYHKAKCCESQSVCSGILDSILDFAATRKTSKNLMVNEDTTFRWSCCENIIENFEDFVVHKFSDHNIPLLTCGLCLCVKDTKTQLKKHYQKFHFFKFWNRMELKKHGHQEKGATSTVSSSTQIEDVLIKTDDGSSDSDEVRAKPVQCSALQDGILCQCCDCTKVVEETQSLKAITIEDLNDLNKPFQCEPCNLRFCHKSRLNKHLRTHEGVKPFPCDICGNAFTLRISLKNHKLSKHSTNPFKQSCSICGKVLVSKSTLKSHIAKVHMRVNKNIRVRCEHCGKTFAKRSGYLVHIRTIHSIGKELVCDHCNNVFYDKRVLINHIQSMHLPNEKYDCQKCDRNFKTETSLQSHSMKFHSQKIQKDRQFNCEVCGKMFVSNEHLKRHMTVHSDDKQFICHTCGKAFKRYVNLHQHQYTHSERRPHVCDICGQTFRLKTHVKQHMAVHGVIKNRKCLICEKTFARNTELKCHLSTHGI